MTFTLPQKPQSYRWLYADVSNERWTLVLIFMVGSIFSRRYAARAHALPSEYSAVNVALYDWGECRLWALSEYARATLQHQTLTIGQSRWNMGFPNFDVEVKEKTAPWGEPLHFHVHFQAEAPPASVVQLVPELPHYWQAFAPRAHAHVVSTSHAISFSGRAYHDGNFGEEPLGLRLKHWRWTRTHHAKETLVRYEPDGAQALELHSTTHSTTVEPASRADVEEELSPWGLGVPTRLDALAGVQGAIPRRLESSPFYSRLEAAGPHFHALTEVAAFNRFRHPLIRWMADCRTRRELST